MPTLLLADLLPTPRESHVQTGAFTCRPGVRIHHPLGTSDADLRTAGLLADTLKDVTGFRPRVAATTRYVNHHVLYLGRDDRFDVPPDFAPPHHEGYGLRIDRGGILLVGTDAGGLFYAVQTLAQMLRLRRRRGRAIPAMTVRDWPALRHRAVMLDAARQVERADFIETFIRHIAAYKKNMFVLYLEDKFRWRRHPGISHPLGYTHAEFRRMARVAEEHHVAFVPALPTLGHCEGILQHDELARLRTDGAVYQLSLRHPGTRRLLTEQIEEMLPLCRGRHFHVNCDESPLLAGPPGSPKSYLRESVRLFGKHLVFLHDLLARHGRQMMVWGDMLLSHPEIADRLPRDIIIVDWDYGSMARQRRQAPAQFRKLGFPVMVAPAACRSAEVFQPPLMQMADNVPNFIRHGWQAGAVGEMTTLWEMRSTNPIVAWPGVVASAQAAWNPEATSPSQIARRVAAHLHGPEAAGDVVKAYRALGGDGFQRRYGREAATPAIPGRRTYHLDFHEFLATDPLLFLTYRRPEWAVRVSASVARGVADVMAARDQARWGHDDLDVLQLAGMQQAFHADRRRTINEAGRLVLDAERLRRKGHPKAAARKLADALDELSAQADLAEALIPASRDLWRRTRHPRDPQLDNVYLRRLTLDRSCLRRHVARLDRARRRLARGQDVDLGRILGGQPVLLIEAHNPSGDLIDILHATVTVSDDGRSWRILSDKGWYAQTRQTYTVPIIAGPRLPKRVRLSIKRTHINPTRFPPADRIRLRTARTLTPAEILDGPPKADMETIDWRLVLTPEAVYRLRRRKKWVLEFELAKAN